MIGSALMRMSQRLKRSETASPVSSPSGFAAQPFQASAAPGHPALEEAESPREAVEELTDIRLGPVIYEGDQHYVRFRIENGQVELGLNPEWRDLEDILRALRARQAAGGGFSQEMAELGQRAAQTLQRLSTLLSLRPFPHRQDSIEQDIQEAEELAQQLFAGLSQSTQHLDIYGGTLNGDGAEDTDVVGFDRWAWVQAGEEADISDAFEEDDEVLAEESGSFSPDVDMKADGPSLPLDRHEARQVREIQGGGQPLSRELRAFFEERFRTSFAHVRLHTDERADLASRRLNARAFTLGHHIAVRRDQYQPHTTAGRWLLAHELAHALPAGRSGRGGAPRLGYERDRAEHAADRAADAVMAGVPVPAAQGPGLAAASAAADGVVRRAPAGTMADPIKIAFYKTKGIYKNFSATGYSGAAETFKPFQANELPAPKMKTAPAAVGATAVSKPIGGAGPNVKGVRIGVTDPNTNIKGQILQRVLSPARWAEGIFKGALKKRGFIWVNFAPDHLHDLAMSGPDEFPNLWPLDSTTNGNANQTYQQKVTYDDAGTIKTHAVSYLVGKYFKVTKLITP